ncbi:MAG: CorA family divalent cation transporter, partial [Mesorhizobium sp.]
MAKAKAATVKKRAPVTTRRPPVGASPGTLIADPAARRSDLRLTLISPEKFKTIEDASIDDLNTHCDKWPVIWLDCTGLANIELIEEIGRIFSLHPLALEDVVNTGQRPKVDFFEDHAFVVVRMIDEVTAHRYEQIAVFFGRNFVVTFQEREGDPFDPVRKRIESSAPNRLRARGADYLAYALIDAIVDSYFPPIEAAGEMVDSIEDQMLNTPHKHQMRQLHELRRDANVLKGVLWPMRDALATMIRSELAKLREIAERLQADRPLSQATFERVTQLLARLPGVKVDATASLPETTDGATVLVLKVKRQPYNVSLGADVRQPTPRAVLSGVLNDPFGSGGQLSASTLLGNF